MVTVGQILNQERTKKGITLKQVEKALRVRQVYLKALEENNWQIFSSKIYITGLIKNYSAYLGVNTQKALLFFRRDYERKEDVKFNKRVSSRYLSSETKRVAFLGIATLIIAFVIYFGYQLTLFLAPPKITIISPIKTEFRAGENLAIKAKTERTAEVTIMGDRIYQDKDGVFTYDFPLKKGSNVLTVEIIGANGKKTIFKKLFTGI